MQRGCRALATVSDWGAIVAAIAVLVACAPHAMAADRFDYHSVRGRQPSTSAAQAPTTGQPISTSDTTHDAAPLTTDEIGTATRQFCVRCHGGDSTEGDLDLSGFGSLDAPPADARVVQQIRDRIAYRGMSPVLLESFLALGTTIGDSTGPLDGIVT